MLKSDQLTILIGQPLQGLPYLPHVVDLLKTDGGIEKGAGSEE